MDLQFGIFIPLINHFETTFVISYLNHDNYDLLTNYLAKKIILLADLRYETMSRLVWSRPVSYRIASLKNCITILFVRDADPG